MKKLVLGVTVVSLAFVGCADKSPEYYKAVSERNKIVVQERKEAKQAGFTFSGKFDGMLSYTIPKAPARVQNIVAPKTGKELVLDYFKVLIPVGIAATGMHYNYKTAKINAETTRDIALSGDAKDTSMFENFTSSTAVNTSVTDTSSTSITDTSVSTSVSATSITDTSNTSTTDTSVQTNEVPSVVADGNVTVGN